MSNAMSIIVRFSSCLPATALAAICLSYAAAPVTAQPALEALHQRIDSGASTLDVISTRTPS
jgi:hypothetical protein